MNKSFKKFFIYLLILGTIFTSTVPAFAASNMPYIIHETKESQYLGSGILYENIKKFTSRGWWNINLVRVDLTDEYAEIKGLMSSSGLSNRNSVSKLVTDNKAVAGVNGDFFNYNPIPHPMGTFIEDGQIISSPIERAYALPTFYLNNDKKADIAFFDRNMNITSLNSGKSVPISLINKAADFNMVTLLNKRWGAKSFGNRFHKDVVEMVVIDNVVKEIRIGKEPIAIPDNGYIITVRGDRKEPLLDNFNVGDEVKLNIGTTPNLEDIKFAIGGGSIILKDGVVTNTNINIKGDQPRTGIGITKDGNELIIATIDGRHTSYKGVSQEMFGAILKDLGAYNAINLDGGGSTTMAIKPVDEQVSKVVNRPSDGGQRLVPNGVGVFSNAPKGELSYITVSTDDKKMFPNTSRKFKIKGFDQYHNPIEVDQSKATYTFEGIEGEMTLNTLKAKSSGKATITANYEGLTSTIDIRVLGEVKDIALPVDKFNLNINSQKDIGILNGKDKDGFAAKIYPEDVEWTVVNDIGYVENGVFYSKEKSGSGAITGRIGEGVKSILVSIGTNDTIIENFENLENFKSTSYPEYVKHSIGISPISKQGKNSISLKYDFSQGDKTRAAYLNLTPQGKNGLDLGQATKLGLWVKGDGKGSWLRGSIKDKNGNEHTIDFVKSLNSTDWQYTQANIPSNVAYPITLERIYIVETDSSKKHSGEILLDGLTGTYPAAYDKVEVPTPSKFKDERNIKSNKEDNGFSFIVTKAPSNLDELAGYNASSKIQSKANQHNVALFMGGTSPKFREGIKTEKILNTGTNYVKTKYKNVLFIDANSSKGGIRPTNPDQWRWLKHDLFTSGEEHIVLILPTPIFGSGGFTDVLEAELLHDVLVEISESGKNIWVVHGGNSTKTDLKDGIRYIQYNNSNITAKEQIANINAVEFIVNGSNITYQINPMFK